MKLASRLVPLLLLLLAFPALADDGTPPSPTQPSSARRAHGKRLNPSATSKNPGTIRGRCTVVESDSNPIAGPCVDMVLLLNDEKGNEVLRTRTSAKGDFEFAADPAVKYRVGSGSKFYDLVQPEGLLHGGASVDMRLRQK
jgi:hypothetical protein